MPDLTKNTMRVLLEVKAATDGYDAFIPHAIPDRVGLKFLLERGLVRPEGPAECQTCSTPHEGPAYTLTEKGREVTDA